MARDDWGMDHPRTFRPNAVGRDAGARDRASSTTPSRWSRRGRSPRVVVAGIHFGDQLIEPAREMATDAGVRLVPLWMPDEAGSDIAIERIDR